MKKFIIHTSILLGLSLNANAALVNNGSMTLAIDQGVGECLIGGIYPNCDFGAFSETSGSFWYFNYDVNFPDPTPLDKNILPSSGISSNAGIVLGMTQPLDVVPDENMMNLTTSIFSGPSFFYSTTPTQAVSDTEIDFSGLRWALDSFSDIKVDGDAFATISCGECNIGDRYTLEYSAHTLEGNSGGIGWMPMTFRLEGTIVSTVPVPASVWLMGSGLIGLVGFARRKHND